MNEEFEKWWREEGRFIRAGGGQYEISFAFGAWQASRKQALNDAFKVCQTKMGARGCEHGIRKLMKD